MRPLEKSLYSYIRLRFRGQTDNLMLHFLPEKLEPSLDGVWADIEDVLN